MYRTTATLAFSMLAIGAMAMPAGAIKCDQTSSLPRPVPLGVSGGNINGFFSIGREEFCGSGTLGSMVQDQRGNQYILSNNHVIATSTGPSPAKPSFNPA
jgi:hypothetical protein